MKATDKKLSTQLIFNYMKSIEITITEDSQITIEGTGFKGKACDKAMEAFEVALGKQTERKNKAEYYQVTTGNVQTT